MKIISFEDYLNIMKNGVYLGVRPDEQSTKTLMAVQSDVLSGSQATPHDDFHVTLIYSKQKGAIPQLSPFAFYDAEITGFDLFGDERNVLVVRLACPGLDRRHQELLNSGLTHTYPDYNAHLTLTYDYRGQINPEWDKWYGTKLRFIGEYFMPIDTDYA